MKKEGLLSIFKSSGDLRAINSILVVASSVIFAFGSVIMYLSQHYSLPNFVFQIFMFLCIMGLGLSIYSLNEYFKAIKELGLKDTRRKIVLCSVFASMLVVGFLFITLYRNETLQVKDRIENGLVVKMDEIGMSITFPSGCSNVKRSVGSFDGNEVIQYKGKSSEDEFCVRIVNTTKVSEDSLSVKEIYESTTLANIDKQNMKEDVFDFNGVRGNKSQGSAHKYMNAYCHLYQVCYPGFHIIITYIYPGSTLIENKEPIGDAFAGSLKKIDE